MKKNIVLFFIIIATCNLLKAQNFSTFRDSIVKENLEKDIMFLCDLRFPVVRLHQQVKKRSPTIFESNM